MWEASTRKETTFQLGSRKEYNFHGNKVSSVNPTLARTKTQNSLFGHPCHTTEQLNAEKYIL